jgi:hypothetical protein
MALDLDLTSVIEDSLTDATLPEDPIPDTPDPVDAAPAASSDSISDSVEPEDPSVPSPAAKTATTPEDDEFAKKYGIPGQSATGRENRIPYSRVKKIADRAAKDAVTAKETELKGTYDKQLTEFQGKVQQYEGRLQQVAQFEQMMATQPREFLNRLASIPAYREIFQSLMSQGQPQQAPPDPNADMPQPDQQLEDGTMVYSLEGLKALNAWNREQARNETLAAVDARYGQIEQAWQANQQIARLRPVVEAQIETARKWPLFNESEPEIVQALADNPRASLAEAYQAVVLPKLLAEKDKLSVDKNKVRAEVLAELRNAPSPTTSAPVRASRPVQQTSTGPRNLEDVIREASQGVLKQ